MNIDENLKFEAVGSERNSSPEKTMGYNKMMNILLNQEKFEGEINTPEEFRAVVDALLQDKVKLSSSLKRTAKEIDKIIKKIEKGGTITTSEEEAADDFEIIMESFQNALQPLCLKHCEEQMNKVRSMI